MIDVRASENCTVETVWGEEVASILSKPGDSYDPDYRIPLHQRPAWLMYQNGEDLQRLGTIVLRRAGTAKGYAPFLVRRRNLKSFVGEVKVFSFPLRCVQFVGTPFFPSDSSAWDGLFARVNEIPNVEGIFFEGLPCNSFLWNYIHQSATTRNMVRYVSNPPTEHFVISMPESFNAYMGKFSSQTRRKLRRVIITLEELLPGKLRLDKMTEETEVDSFVENAVRVSKTTYQWHLLGMGLRDASAVKAELRFLARQGWARCYLLWCDQTPVAFMLCQQDESTCYQMDVGFDPEWSQYSVGTVLQLLVLQDLFAFKQPQVFDFGRGAGEHKRFFGNTCYLDADLYLLRRRLYPLLACGVNAAVAGASSAADGVLKRMGLKRGMKKLIRRSSIAFGRRISE